MSTHPTLRGIIYFYYLTKYFLDRSIQKIFYIILKKEALVVQLLMLLQNIGYVTQKYLYFYCGKYIYKMEVKKNTWN